MSKKGYKQTEEHKRKIGESNKLTCTLEIRKRYSKMYKGKKRPEITGKKHPLWGKSLSEETRSKMSRSKMGKIYPKQVEANRQNAKKRMGIKRPVSVGEKISKAKRGIPNLKGRGVNSGNWKGGINPINDSIRKSLEMKIFKKDCLKRDNWTCKKTGQRGGKLVVHHILNFSDNPELRFNIENGITLSRESHIEFHKIYGKKNNTREQLLEFLKN